MASILSIARVEAWFKELGPRPACFCSPAQLGDAVGKKRSMVNGEVHVHINPSLTTEALFDSAKADDLPTALQQL